MYKRMLGETIYRLRKEKGLSQEEYEFISDKKTKKDLPFLHIHVGKQIQIINAKARGLVSIGAIAIGLVSYGAVSIGYYAHTITDRGYAIGKYIFFH